MNPKEGKEVAGDGDAGQSLRIESGADDPRAGLVRSNVLQGVRPVAKGGVHGVRHRAVYFEAAGTMTDDDVCPKDAIGSDDAVGSAKDHAIDDTVHCRRRSD